MAGFVLDPGETRNVQASISLERIPASVRKFGFYPNITKLQAGDLVLVSPVKAGVNARLIRWTQSRWHDSDDMEWVHAAMYLGDDSLVEIDTPGVAVVFTSKYVGAYRLKFRRPQKVASINGALKKVDVNQAEGFRIAVAALKNFKTSYGFADIVGTGAQSIWNAFAPDSRIKTRTKGSICSDFYCDAVYTAMELHPASVKRQPIQPGDLSASANMTDLDIEWARLT